MEKKVILSLVAIFGVVLASTMIFAQEDPDLAPFNATVTIQGVAPAIFVVNVSDGVGTPVNTIEAIPGSQANTIVTVMVEDANGAADLPSTTASFGPGAAEDINLTIIKGGQHAPLTRTVPISGSCAEVTCDPSICGVWGTTGATSQRMYQCTPSVAVMEGYYEPSSGQGGDASWNISATATDLSGQTSLVNDTFEFAYTQVPGIDASGEISWSTGISPAGSDQQADTHLTVTNLGNRVETALDLTGYNLTGRDFPGVADSYVPAVSFSADGTSAVNSCDNLGVATPLVENTAQSVDGWGNLDYGPAESTTVFFCIWEQLSNHPSGLTLSSAGSPYQANGTIGDYPVAGTSSWRIVTQ